MNTFPLDVNGLIIIESVCDCWKTEIVQKIGEICLIDIVWQKRNKKFLFLVKSLLMHCVPMSEMLYGVCAMWCTEI